MNLTQENNPMLAIWNDVCRPPATALKTIGGGRLSGMTDINPTWRMKCMTELFGPVGFGWNYTIVRDWTVKGNGDELMVFVEVSMRYKWQGEWSEPVPGVGGNKIVVTERSGIHNNDEAYKMATTDALSVAMKAMGVGAEIYMGNFDGSKYRDAGDIAHPGRQRDATPRGGKTPPQSPPESNPAPTQPPAFNWASSTSAKRLARLLDRVAAALAMENTEHAIDALNKLYSWFSNKKSDLIAEDLAKAEEAFRDAEAKLS